MSQTILRLESPGKFRDVMIDGRLGDQNGGAPRNADAMERKWEAQYAPLGVKFVAMASDRGCTTVYRWPGSVCVRDYALGTPRYAAVILDGKPQSPPPAES